MANTEKYADCAALIIGVSNYNKDGFCSLPECEADAIGFRNALTDSVFVNPERIKCLYGTVLKDEFESALANLIEQNPRHGIIFFSGHGSQNGITCNLQFTDYAEPAKRLVEEASKSIPSLLIVLDCCYAGALNINFNEKSVLESESSNGCYLFLASTSKEGANGRLPNEPMSPFTYRLVHALQSGYSRARGVIDFDSVSMFLRTSMEVLDKQLEGKLKQHVVIRSTGYTSLQISNPRFAPYEKQQPGPIVFRNSIIKEIAPLHSSSHKRYSVKALVGNSLDCKALVEAVELMIDHIKTYDLYVNEQQEKYWVGRKVTHVFLYLYTSEFELENCNQIISASWVSRNANREAFYRASGRVINDIYFEENNSHEIVKDLLFENRLDKTTSIEIIKELSDELIKAGRFLFGRFDEYMNHSLEEEGFINEVESFQLSYRAISQKVDSIGFASGCYKHALELLIDIDGAIGDGILFYTHEEFLSRDAKNRTLCMMGSKARYDKAVIEFLDLLNSLKKTIGAFYV